MRTWSGTFLALMRQGLPALAVYALLLQAFLVGAAPSATLARDGVLCSETSKPGQTHAPFSAHDCLCLSHCAQPLPAGAPPQAAALPVPMVLTLAAPLPADERDAAAPAHRRPGARAPPVA